MSTRKKIEKMIEEKKHEVEHYRSMIREVEIYLKALEDTLLLLPCMEQIQKLCRI